MTNYDDDDDDDDDDDADDVDQGLRLEKSVFRLAKERVQ